MKSIVLSVFALLVLTAGPAIADWVVDPSVFEPTYYADQNADVRGQDGYSEAKLVEHWRNFGLKEGRKSSPVFDVRYYMEHNLDVAKNFGRDNYIKGAQHWYQTGRQEGRPSHPGFQVKKYLQINADVAREYGEHNYLKAIDHYLRTGYKEGRKAN